MKNNLVIILFLVLIFATIGLKIAKLDKDTSSDGAKYVTVQLNTVDLKLKVLDTDTLRIKGLSDSISLPENEGMLFVFDRPGYHGIWMKDMKYPIDIAWLDQFRKVIHIERNVSPDTYPQVFLPPTEDVYVIEVNSNFLEKHGIKIGDEINF